MSRTRHAHRQPQRQRAVALLVLAVGVLVTTLPTQAGADDGRPAGPAALTAQLARRDAERTSPHSRAAVPLASPSIGPAVRPFAAPSVEPAGADTMGGAGAPTRPDVAVPSAEVRTTIGPGAGATAVFLGDSYTSGWKGAGVGKRGWPRLVGSARGWRTVNLAVAGTGFLNAGWTDQPIRALIAKAAKADPDVIVLAGGHNDSRWSAAETARAADDVIDRLRAAAPDALLVIVAPIWQDGSPPQRCLALRDHLNARAAEVGAVFVDPLADGWFGGARHRLIGRDGIHPTDAGHRFIADQVLAALDG